MTLLKTFTPFGPSILPIVETLKCTGPFIIVTLGAICGMTHMIYVLNTRDDPFSPLYSAWMLTFRLGVLGDVDRFEVEGTDTIYQPSSDGSLEPEDPSPTSKFGYVMAWVLLTALVINMFLLQLLVGVLGSNYDFHESQSRRLFVKDRCRTIVRMTSHIWYRHFLRRSFDEAKLLFFAVKAQLNDEDNSSIRSALHRSRGQLQKWMQEAGMDVVKQDVDDIKASMDDLKRQLAEMKDLPFITRSIRSFII